MTIEQSKTIDAVAIDKNSQLVILLITDARQWIENDLEHLYFLQEKINACFEYIEGGQLLQEHPRTFGYALVIELKHKYEISKTGQDFLQKASDTCSAAGCLLRVKYAP